MVNVRADPPFDACAPRALGFGRALLARRSTACRDRRHTPAAAPLQSSCPRPYEPELGHQFCGIFHSRHGSFHSIIKTPPSRREARGGGRVFHLRQLLRFSPVLTGSAGVARCFIGRDRLRLRTPLAPRRPLLAVAIHVRLARLGRIRVPPLFARAASARHLAPPPRRSHPRSG